MRYVIIGNSAAGVNAAEEIRRKDSKSTVTIVSEEKDIAYSRCLISRFLDRRLKESDLYFKTKDFYQACAVEPALGKKVEGIDRLGQNIVLDDTKKLSYDSLLLAVGSKPVRPKVCGLDLSGVFNFYTLDDTRCIINYINKVKRAVVVGAGFVGLEAAYALRKAGIGVTVVERCPQILPNQFDYISSELIKGDLEGLGIEIIVNESLTSINGKDKVEGVTIAENTDMPCEMVIFATGVQPNTELAASAGLSKGRGIVVDEFMRTSDANIYAAGDCVEIEDVASGKRQPSATWFNAVLQGKFAAANMSGSPQRYTGAVGIQNSVQFHRLSAVSFGMTQIPEGDLDYEIASVTQQDRKAYKKLVIKDNHLLGMIFVGDISKAGFYAALIRNRVDICKFKDKLLEPDFSHAYFRQENFEQVSPYAAIPSCWESPGWAMERPICMGIG